MTTAIHKLLTRGKRLLVTGWHGASFARFLTEVRRDSRRIFVIVTEDAKRAASLVDALRFFDPQSRVALFPQDDVQPYHGLSPHPRSTAETLRLLHELSRGQVAYVVVPYKALLRRRLPRAAYDKLLVKLQSGFTVDRGQVAADLAAIGYARVPVVEEPGQFAVRGDVIDVFPPHEESPLRASFFDRDIEWIRRFDPDTQRTTVTVADALCPPTREIFLDFFSDAPAADLIAPEEINASWKRDLKAAVDARDLPKTKRDQIEDFVRHGIYFHGIETFLPLFYRTMDAFFSYLPDDAVLVRDTVDALPTLAKARLKELEAFRDGSQHVETAIVPDRICLTPDEVAAALARFSVMEHELSYDALTEGSPDLPVHVGRTAPNTDLRARLAVQIAKIHNLAPLASELNQKRLEGFRCLIVCKSEVQRERIVDLLKRFDLPLSSATESDPAAVLATMGSGADPARLIAVMVGELHEGFRDDGDRTWWITDEEIFGKKTRRAPPSAAKTSVFSSFSELSPGDAVIHMDHGIGIYQGLVKLAYDAHQNDFLTIEYLGGDKLYVPVDKLNRVQRYAAEEGVLPQLDKLGGTTWKKVREKAKRAARKLAAELLALQAKREALSGYAFGAHREALEEFAASFEFEETPDQQLAIEDVARDMESGRPMDRLICGDVGFGKTEVAIRAAYKALLDGKQVAVLVPTTVLAFQHYATFKKRMENYAAKVDLLSRFRSEREQNETIKKLKEGAVDIVVGTHRLISQDVKFNDLGLLVIDEEHRFGVIHKEKIKKMRSQVDVMTLTATPIPRTLNFALNGIRDLSVINTPPHDRLAVKTYTISFDEHTMRDAMMRELKRGGQIYFVHNRVQSIEKIFKQVSKLVPEARVRFAHGQMDEDGLERAMIAFMNKEFDVLVCTTIIESGLDIPNANTMIINRADQMGLAQLYQLRGRVGRSHHQAYCYLVVPDEELVNPQAKKRLIAIQKFTELGSGFKIASHDLEIRGAGNILGDEQSGHIAAVGYDTYLQLLKEAVHELKNEAVPQDFVPEVLLNVAAKIPESFVSDAQLRLILYKQLSSAESLDDVDATREEWMDRFGKLPKETENLLRLIKIRVACKDLLVASLKSGGAKLTVTLHPDHRLDAAVLVAAVQRNPKKFAITREGQFVVNGAFEDADALLDWTAEFLDKLKEARLN